MMRQRHGNGTMTTMVHSLFGGYHETAVVGDLGAWAWQQVGCEDDAELLQGIFESLFMCFL